MLALLFRIAVSDLQKAIVSRSNPLNIDIGTNGIILLSDYPSSSFLHYFLDGHEFSYPGYLHLKGKVLAVKSDIDDQREIRFFKDACNTSNLIMRADRVNTFRISTNDTFCLYTQFSDETYTITAYSNSAFKQKSGDTATFISYNTSAKLQYHVDHKDQSIFPCGVDVVPVFDGKTLNANNRPVDIVIEQCLSKSEETLIWVVLLFFSFVIVLLIGWILYCAGVCDSSADENEGFSVEDLKDSTKFDNI